MKTQIQLLKKTYNSIENKRFACTRAPILRKGDPDWVPFLIHFGVFFGPFWGSFFRCLFCYIFLQKTIEN